jgi:two-component system, OmpR family, response regulator
MLARPKSRIRVLIADSDSRSREALARFLSEHGVSAGQTGSGDELLRVLKRDRYDLVVLDIMLSGESGINLCRKVRAVSAIPIILLSATSEEADCIVGLEVGADDYLAKPVNPREVLARIRAILRRSALMVEPVPHSSCFGFDGWTMDRTSSIFLLYSSSGRKPSCPAPSCWIYCTVGFRRSSIAASIPRSVECAEKSKQIRSLPGS